jgi:hypothetical protein
MSRFPKIIKNKNTGCITLDSDIGLDLLIQELYGNISEAKVSNEKIWILLHLKDARNAIFIMFGATGKTIVSSADNIFFKSIQNKGFPISFPEIIPTKSDTDLSIQAMYHSLLTCFSKKESVVPNDVSTTADQNVRLITGATLYFITHYHVLGDEFRDSPYVTQLCCKLDHSNDPPAYTYKIGPGVSVDSDDLVVASEYGVNKKNLDILLEQKARRGDFKLRK